MVALHNLLNVGETGDFYYVLQIKEDELFCPECKGRLEDS
jgi:hypothetical protein